MSLRRWIPRIKRLPGQALSCTIFLWRAAWGAHVPLIWHILVVAAAAAGTYYLTPKISEQLERQRIRAGYISNNLTEMNELIGDFYVAIMQATSESDPERARANFQKVDELGTRLSWKTIEISAVLPSDRDRALLQKFQMRLRSVQKAAVVANEPGKREAFRQELAAFAETSVLVIQGVAQRAELSISVDPAVSSE